MSSQFPSIGEHDGFYNLDADSYRAHLVKFGDDAKNHQTSKSVPTLVKAEFKDAVAALYSCFWRQAQGMGLSMEEAKCLYSFAICESMYDRTVQVLLPQPEELTSKFIEEIQSEVLAFRPLWRVLIRSEDDSRTVLVYPKAVRVGFARADADWKKELAIAITKEVKHQDKVKGHFRRQVRYLADRVKAAISLRSDRVFKLLAAFDNYRGNSSEWTVWILFEGENSEDLTVEYTEGVATSYEFAVRDDGYFGPLFKSDNAKHWLRAWVYPAASTKVTIMRQKDYEPVPGMVFDVDIAPESVIRDADLQRGNG